MDPKTGAILAMASRPSFKLSELVLDDAEPRPLPQSRRHRPLRARLRDQGADDGDGDRPGPRDAGHDLLRRGHWSTKGGYTFKNWDFSANGIADHDAAAAEVASTPAPSGSATSSAPNKLYDSFDRFGFGESTHSGLGGEADRPRAHQQGLDDWYPSDLATNSYGQGIAATPLQVITAISSVINGGKLMRPYIVAGSRQPERPPHLRPGRRARRPISPRRLRRRCARC